VSGVLICEWNFWSMSPEVCDVGLKNVARRLGSRRVAGELIDANIEFHLQLYFSAGVFLARAWCVSGLVFQHDGMA
jgi:hypothetical protein